MNCEENDKEVYFRYPNKVLSKVWERKIFDEIYFKLGKQNVKNSERMRQWIHIENTFWNC